MRNRFKFRAWDKLNNKMIPWKWLFSFKSVCGLFDNSHLELMQCTGISDKNGKLIYEGDIVRTWANPEDYNGYEGHDYIEVVEYDDDHLFFALSEGHGLKDFEFIEVLSNIYQNPNLLKNDK